MHDLGEVPPPPQGDADLSVDTSDSVDPVRVGRRPIYTVVVANDGPSAATEVILTDTLPRTVRVGPITTTAGTCTGGARVVTCSLGTIESGDSVTVTIRVTPNRPGELSNTATVNATQTDPDPSDNTNTEHTTSPRRNPEGEVSSHA